MTLDLVPLTPQQHAEVQELDEGLVSAWVDAYLHAPASIEKPVGWFLNGVRSGVMPFVPSSADSRRAELSAEQWIRNAGLFFDRESEVEDALFGELGMLRGAVDAAVHERLLGLWRALRVDGDEEEA